MANLKHRPQAASFDTYSITEEAGGCFIKIKDDWYIHHYSSGVGPRHKHHDRYYFATITDEQRCLRCGDPLPDVVNGFARLIHWGKTDGRQTESS